jgi:hypothetical protein
LPQDLPPLLIAVLPATGKVELNDFRIITLMKTMFELRQTVLFLE